MKKDKIIKTSITILLILLPFLDMLRTTNIRHFEVFGISIIEVFNIILIGVAFILTLTKCSKKQLLFVFSYLILVGIYIYLHYKHIITFDKSIFPRANFSFVTETYYIGRVYLLPLALLFILIKNKDIFNKEFYFKIIKIVIGIISISIIVLDILKLSYISYSENHNFLTNSILDYLFYTGDFRQLSARGWFDSANELSAVMFMLFPLNIYLLYKEKGKSNLILFISQFIAMILLGTRTSAVGAVLIAITAFIIYIITVLFNKTEADITFIKRYAFVSLICITFFSVSPFMIARLNEGKADFSVKDAEAYTSLNENIKDEKKLDKLFEKYKSEYMINELYLKIYPFKNDTAFWLKIAARDKSLNNNSRIIKTDIIKRIKERNNNKMDSYLGMGYTLNMIDLERDYYYQYYLFGIIGVLLLMGPYFAVLGYLVVRCLCNFKKNFNFETITYFMGPCLGLLIAYYSGHVFGWVSPMMWLTVTLALVVFTVNDNCLKNDKDLLKEEEKNKKELKSVLKKIS